MKHVAHLTPHAWANDAFAKLVGHGGSITDIGMSAPINITPTITVSCPASVGAADTSAVGYNAAVLIDAADKAMYETKRARQASETFTQTPGHSPCRSERGVGHRASATQGFANLRLFYDSSRSDLCQDRDAQQEKPAHTSFRTLRTVGNNR